MKALGQLDVSTIIDLVKRADKKTRTQIGIGAFVGIVLVVFIIWPAWIQRIQIRHQIRLIQGQIDTVHTLSLKREEWLRNQTEYGKHIGDAKGRLFQPSETSLLLGAISKLADESKVSIIASRPKDSEEKIPPPFDAQYERSLFDFTVEGDFHALGTLVSRIESNPKLLRIQIFRISPQEEKPERHLADLSLSAVSFKRKV